MDRSPAHTQGTMLCYPTPQPPAPPHVDISHPTPLTSTVEHGLSLPETTALTKTARANRAFDTMGADTQAERQHDERDCVYRLKSLR